MARDEEATAPDGAVVTLSEIGHEVVFENEHVRVWEVRLEPGDVQPWHMHRHPYLVIAIEQAENRMDFLDGSEAREMLETVGRVVFREPGKVHMLTNVGQTRYLSRLVELKCLSDGEGEGAGDGRREGAGDGRREDAGPARDGGGRDGR